MTLADTVMYANRWGESCIIQDPEEIPSWLTIQVKGKIMITSASLFKYAEVKRARLSNTVFSSTRSSPVWELGLRLYDVWNGESSPIYDAYHWYQAMISGQNIFFLIKMTHWSTNLIFFF